MIFSMEPRADKPEMQARIYALALNTAPFGSKMICSTNDLNVAEYADIVDRNLLGFIFRYPNGEFHALIFRDWDALPQADVLIDWDKQ